MNTEFDVVAIGELLIDFTETGLSPQGNRLLEVNPGGAPCNVLAMLNRLGKKTSFIGKVGEDQFGRMLKSRLEGIGIGTSNLVFDKEVNTTLAFVETKPGGDREFSFYRHPGADMMLKKSEVDVNLIKNTRALHYGTLSMTDDECREATMFAIKTAREAGCLLTFDPNLRIPLWSSDQLAREQIDIGLDKCDIVKIADNELEFMSGEKDCLKAARIILKKHKNIRLLCATLGKEGCIVFYDGLEIEQPGFVRKDTVETTGAGDTFCACMINGVLDAGLDDLSENYLKNMARFANAAASIITTRKGALCVMPSKEEVDNFLSEL